VARATIAAAILAGGKARRFGGQDKSRLLVRGRPIIVRQLEVLQRVADTITVVAPDGDRFADLGVPVHADLIPGAGAMGGVYTALETAAADRVLVVACDMPFLSEAVLRRLAALAEEGDAAWVRTAVGVEPLLACYRRSARTAIHAAITAGRLKLAELQSVLAIRELDESSIAALEPVEDVLANVNSPADYRKVE
jgi:molybdopterin-guanine dinucleotide biosynthesis protein A